MSDAKINENSGQSNLLPMVNPTAFVMNPEEIEAWRIKLENFQRLLHRKPKKTASRQNIQYVPIDTVETTLDELFFGLWKWEILFEPKREMNEILVCGRIHFFHPVAQTWLFRDGVGVAQIRMKKDTDFTNYANKIQNALEMDIPHAEADALKSAAGKIGNKFGRNLRRELKDNYEGLYKEEVKISKELDDLYMNVCAIIGGYENSEQLRKDKDSILGKAIKLPAEYQQKLADELQSKYNELRKVKK